MNNIKTARTKYPVIDLIKKRWSPRSYSNKTISETEINTLLEAASWAPSGNNLQPWEFHYASRGSEAFDKIFQCLMPGNQAWAGKASHLIISLALIKNEETGKENIYATHDLGMANALLLLQGAEMGIYGRQMAGFDRNKLTEIFSFSEAKFPVCLIALGYPDTAEQLDEINKAKEIAQRDRKSLHEFAVKL